GLGAEYARLFAGEKHGLVLVARRRERLESLAAELRSAHGVEVEVVPADLATPGGAARLVEEVGLLGSQVDFLVNNAGFGASGRFAELELARELAMIELNITSLVTLTRAFLPAMIARRSGRT